MTQYYLKIYEDDDWKTELDTFDFIEQEGFQAWSDALTKKLYSYKFCAPLGWDFRIHKEEHHDAKYQVWPATGKEIAIKKADIQQFFGDETGGHSWAKSGGILKAFSDIQEKKAEKFVLKNSEPVKLPEMGAHKHQQGIQRTARGEFVVTGSASGTGYFYVADQKGNLKTVTAPKVGEYDHMGGCQVSGDFLALGYERLGGGSSGTSTVYLYDMAPAGEPKRLDHLTIERNRGHSTSGAVALCQTKHCWLLGVANWNADEFQLYRSTGLDLRDSATSFEPVGALDHGDIKGWGEHQNINLFTEFNDAQGTENIWLVGMYTAGYIFSKDIAILYKLDVKADEIQLQKMHQKHFKNAKNGARFRYAGGMYFDPVKRKFEVYACEGNLNEENGLNRCNKWT